MGQWSLSEVRFVAFVPLMSPGVRLRFQILVKANYRIFTRQVCLIFLGCKETCCCSIEPLYPAWGLYISSRML